MNNVLGIKISIDVAITYTCMQIVILYTLIMTMINTNQKHNVTRLYYVNLGKNYKLID